MSATDIIPEPSVLFKSDPSNSHCYQDKETSLIMATSKPFMNTDRLKGRENYREWCFDIKNILVIETVWSAIEG
jgi:hypothetical protein